MGFVDDLFTIKGKKGVFTLILTATILSIFETVFFYKIVVPNVEGEMDHHIKEVGIQIAQNINEKTIPMQNKNALTDVTIAETKKIVFNDKIKYVLKTFQQREQELVDEVNMYTVYTGIVLILTFSILLYLIWYSIKTDPHVGVMFRNMVEDSDMTDATLSAVLTVGPLIAFQIFFYFFGKQYKYPGSFGKEELSWEIINGIDVE